MHDDPTKDAQPERGTGASPDDLGFMTERRAISFFQRHAAEQDWDVSEHESFTRRITPRLAPMYGLRSVEVPKGVGQPDITLRRRGELLLVADVVDKTFASYGDFETNPVHLDDERLYIDHPGPLAPMQRAVNAKAMQAPEDDVPFVVIIGTSPRGKGGTVPSLSIHDLAIGLEGGDLPADRSAWLAAHSPVSAAALLSHRGGDQFLEVLINPRAAVPLEPEVLQFGSNVVEMGMDFRRRDHLMARRWARDEARDGSRDLGR